MQLNKKCNTFGLGVNNKSIIYVHSREELFESFSCGNVKINCFNILGQGSNVIISDTYSGKIIVNCIKGLEVEDFGPYSLLTLGAGESWDDIVRFAINNKLYGIENLGWIPGCVGACPIQNIGAFGAEFKDVCLDVTYYDAEKNKVCTLTALECKFGYRNSIFKNKENRNWVVISVRIKLMKSISLNLSYGPLKELNEQTTSLKELYKFIGRVRCEKLPNPRLLGNSGSFFKNPIVDKIKYGHLAHNFPGIVAFKQNSNYKVSAGWLIDNAKLKGANSGDAEVYSKNALVLINNGSATFLEVQTLSEIICKKINSVYGIVLEHEVVFLS
jgi:UDP-N-acetylmuramate dehydrogenase